MRNIYLDTIREQIKKIQKEVTNTIPNINCGGCIHFTHYLTKALDKIHVNYNITLLDSYDSISKYIKNNEAVSHVCVFIRGIGYVDGERTIFRKEELGYRRFKSCNIDTNYFRQGSNWNVSYNTKNNKKLKTIINKHLGGN